MAVGDLPLIGMLKTRMQWHQARQKLLAENVSNADTPGFKPRDLRQPAFTPTGALAASGVRMDQTDAGHIGPTPASAVGDPRDARRFETTPSGNAVNMEDELLKAAQNQGDYALAASLYQKSMQMLKIATGKR